MRDNLLHRVVVYFVNISDCWQNKWQFIVWMMLVANIPYCLIGVFFLFYLRIPTLSFPSTTNYLYSSECRHSVSNFKNFNEEFKINQLQVCCFERNPVGINVVWSTKFKNCYNLWHLFMYTNSKYLLLQLS